MRKVQPYGDTHKSQLKAAARDKAYRFMLAGDTVRGVIVHTTRVVNEMRANHILGILETLALGHAYTAAIMMTAGLKGQDRIGLQIECSGPLKGLSVEANAYGEVRGHLKTAAIAIEKPPEDFDLSPFIGAGFLSVTRHLQNAKQPFTGKVALMYGSIAKDLAHYYSTSEQIPTAIDLSIKFDPQGNVTGAGGLLLQAMPAADEATIARIEQQVSTLPSLGTAFAEGTTPKDLILSGFGEHSPRFIADHRVEFMCHCSPQQVRSVLSMLPRADLKDMAAKGPFPVELRCHNCNTTYPFDRSEIEQIYRQRLMSG